MNISVVLLWSKQLIYVALQWRVRRSGHFWRSYTTVNMLKRDDVEKNCLCLHGKSMTTARLMSYQPNVCPMFAVSVFVSPSLSLPVTVCLSVSVSLCVSLSVSLCLYLSLSLSLSLSLFWNLFYNYHLFACICCCFRHQYFSLIHPSDLKSMIAFRC